MRWPSVSSRLSRARGRAAAASRVTSASAVPGGSPERSRSCSSSHSNAESLCAASPSSTGAGSDTPLSWVSCRQSGTAPLWLNSQGPSEKGALADSSGLVPGVASRTAASTAPLRRLLARSGRFGSAQIGTARR